MKLRYTLRASSELEEILAYIQSQSPQGAQRVLVRIRSVTDLLLLHPRAGQRTTNPRLRRMIVSPYPYLIFYEVTDHAVVIHGVRHAARRQSND